MVAHGLYSSGLFNIFLLSILYHWPEDDPLMSKRVATLKIQRVLALLTVPDFSYYSNSVEHSYSAD
jgi:hypothetical protein